MDERLSELKEKQAEIGDKISILQKTNQRKDEEAAEIRKLIAECRENLERIKGTVPGTEELLAPCVQMAMSEPKERENGEGMEDGDDRYGRDDEEYRKNEENAQGQLGEAEDAEGTEECGEEDEEIAGRERTGRNAEKRNLRNVETRNPCVKRDRYGCKTKKKGGKERVSCKVDLNKMKVRIRGPSEDLKKLDAAQLISLLEKFQCQELIINTGEGMAQDPGEIRLLYLMHPGNIVMLAGIIMIAFLINTNLFHLEYNQRTLFFLNLLNVGSVAFHYGMVLWMTFIRGYALRCGLNPDTFQLVDNIMLPKYYSVCVLLSALCLYSFLATHSLSPCSSWPLGVVVQIIVIVTTFIMELITICYVIPALIKLRDATDDYVFDEEDTECAVPESYEKNMVKLCKLNWTLCLINFLTLIFLGANIYYITCQLDRGSNSEFLHL